MKKFLIILSCVLLAGVIGVVSYIMLVEKTIPLDLIPEKVSAFVSNYTFADLNDPQTIPEIGIHYTNVCDNYNPDYKKDITITKQGSPDMKFVEKSKITDPTGNTVTSNKTLYVDGSDYYIQLENNDPVILNEESWKKTVKEEYDILSEFFDFDNGGKIRDELVDMYDNHKKEVTQKGSTVKCILEKDDTNITIIYDINTNKIKSFTKVVKTDSEITNYSHFEFNY